MSRAAACLQVLCAQLQTDAPEAAGPGWLTRLGGHSLSEHASAPQWVALRHLSRPQLPPRALTWHGILVMLSALSFFFLALPSLLQSDSGASQGNLHRTQQARLCFRVLIWVIKFSSINATGFPPLEITPSKLRKYMEASKVSTGVAQVLESYKHFTFFLMGFVFLAQPCCSTAKLRNPGPGFWQEQLALLWVRTVWETLSAKAMKLQILHKITCLALPNSFEMCNSSPKAHVHSKRTYLQMRSSICEIVFISSRSWGGGNRNPLESVGSFH